ncbi:SET domain-containing protein [Cyanobacteria bacterium FACHB-63]|nr:SET domain-containing protein [Cyanobacteria bacterium FACHB-63]
MIHPHTELRFINDKIGYGVFATQFIAKGTITWVRDELDQTLPPDCFTKMPTIFHNQLYKYAFRDQAGNFVLCWDLGRSMNHACDPSCLGYGIDFQVAVRDIHPGEELTTDYAALHLLPHESFVCGCGSARCRVLVMPEDATRLASTWTKAASAVLQNLKTVPQPLWTLMRAEYVDQACHQLGVETIKLLSVRESLP